MSDGILLSEEFHQSCHTFTDGILPLRISISQLTDAFSTSRISISHVTEPFLEMLSHLKIPNLGPTFEIFSVWMDNYVLLDATRHPRSWGPTTNYNAGQFQLVLYPVN